MMDKPYTFRQLWDAVQTLNPKQPIEPDRNYILSMLIPNLIAYEFCRRKHQMPLPDNDIAKNIALNLLTRAYWDLCNGGVYNLDESTTSK